MDAAPIPPSTHDLERRRLESTIDQDLHSLSLGSLITSCVPSYRDARSHSDSLDTVSSIEYPRAFGQGDTGRPMSLVHPSQCPSYPPHPHGPHGTPRAAVNTRRSSAMSGLSEMDSPTSTAGHHVSEVTLGEGVFGTKGYGEEGTTDGDEFDPERSLGRLVGQLGRAMGGRLSPRPASPFAAFSPPRSPSPFSSLHQPNAHNLSLTLNRNNPLPSPPASRAGSGGSSNDSTRPSAAVKSKADFQSRFSSMARELGQEIKARRALGESNGHNIQMEATPAPKRCPHKETEKDRLRTLQAQSQQGHRRPTSAPARMIDGDVRDMTGLTALLETPAKGGEYDTLGKNGDVGGEAGAAIPQTLATLHARLRALESENSLSRRRVRELEVELERAMSEVESARRHGNRQLREVIEEKTALEDLIESLRSHLGKLTLELEQNKALVSELRHAQTQPAHLSPPRASGSVRDELVALRREVERLGKEVHRLGGIVEEGLDTRRRARGERTVRMEEEEAARLARDLRRDDEWERVRRDVAKRTGASAVPHTPGHGHGPGPSKLRQGLHAAAVDFATLMPPTVAPTRIRPSTRHTTDHPPRSKTSASRPQNPTPPSSDDGFDSPTPTFHHGTRSSRQSRVEGPESPFPSIRAEDERDFFATLENDEKQHELGGRQGGVGTSVGAGGAPSPWAKKFVDATRRVPGSSEQSKDGQRVVSHGRDGVPPHTVLTRVISDLEADFAHYKAVYAELADQYKILDAASDGGKRRILAEHLKEVIDTLEEKADQIAALYELLTFKDRPVVGGKEGVSSRQRKVSKSVPDILRMVKETLGDDGMRRLEEDGVGLRRRHAVV